ncbi:hypothetical protein [Paraburkholderia sp. BCC1885]|uniref:hypothetical protein n=1 Tax=Paraburkholderia sp. BCC1885 TaxID=2562669 RepID=UPI001181D5E7|nr:hypothetical protein [Paraburkholderia sp. BCC1885]
MKKFRLLLATLTLTALTPLAHADLAEGAHQFKTDVKTAGKETGHAIGNAGRAVGHGARSAGHAIGRGAKSAGHAVANTTRNGYHATRRWVKEKT